MLGLLILLSVVAIPLGIVIFTIMATKAEGKADKSAPLGRGISAWVFGLCALLSVLWLLRELISPALTLMFGIPAAGIAALLAAASHRFLLKRSKLLAALFGMAIMLLTVFATSLFFALLVAPDQSAALFTLAFAASMLLPACLPLLVLGACAGLLLNYLAGRK